MRIGLLFISIMAFSTNCQKGTNQQALVGAWQVDSTYSFYNGFGYTQTEAGSDWATYVYDEAGIMKEVKYGSFQSYFYELLASDTLTVRPTQGGDPSIFNILELNADRMVLKKNKKPVFSGGNQERYEIRFFSRTAMPEESAIPFSDPRK